MSDGVVLTDESFRKLRREFDELRRQYFNLERNLGHVSTRRHEGGFLPRLKYYMTAGTSTITISSVSETQQNITSHFEIDGDYEAKPARFSLDSGILTAEKSGYYQVKFSIENLGISYRRNDACKMSVTLQGRTNSTAGWGSTLSLAISDEVYHADVDVGAGGSWASNFSGHNDVIIHPVAAGFQYRLITSGLVENTFPGAGCVSAQITFRLIAESL